MDYGFGPYTVQFNAGVTSVPFNISVNNDDISEDDETFNVTVDPFSLPKRVTVGDYGQSIITILDDDGANKII